MAETRAVIYARVSTEQQAKEGLSQDEQVRRCREHIQQKGWTETACYIETMSGTRDDRPELAKLLGTLSDIDVVVIAKLDRLGRNTKHMLEIYETLEAAEVDLLSLSESIDTTTPMGKVMRLVISAFAQLESETIGERVRSTIGARRADGRKHSQFPYGYKKDGRPSAIESPVVKRIFTEAAAGVAQAKIAEKLNKDGFKTRSGTKWSQPRIKTILDNITYTGQIETNEIVAEGKHDGIIDKALWDSVQNLRAANKRGKNGSAAGRKPKRFLFGNGLLRCAHCGGAMVPHTTTSGYEHYLCNTRKAESKDACSMKPVKRASVDAAVFDYFERVCVSIEATQEQLQKQLDLQEVEAEGRLKAAERAKATAAAATEQIDKDYLEGDIDGKTHQRLYQKAENDLIEAEADLSLASMHMDAVSKEPQAVTEAAEAIAALRAEIAGEVSDASGLEAVRARLSTLFSEILVAQIDETSVPLSPEIQAVMDAQAEQYADEQEPLEVGRWIVTPMPRGEWVGGLEGYWQEVLEPSALPIAGCSKNQRP
ncbi:MAG TPA: recombinase family protein [Solirubrobacteraceae bacterium]|jgi:DNA invertase Pin-like site-specific DNA recombinase|nr:recombinase family protein [Solirubrobacteraceae bacterium]